MASWSSDREHVDEGGGYLKGKLVSVVEEHEDGHLEG